MGTLTSLNIHDVVDVQSSTEVISSKGSSFTVTKYCFIDSEGNWLTVKAFLAEEQDK